MLLNLTYTEYKLQLHCMAKGISTWFTKQTRGKNFLLQNTFFREIIFLALTFFPREDLLIAKNQCHLPREKNQCHFQNFRQIDEILESGIGFSPQGGGIDFWQLVNSPQGKKLMPKK